MVYMTKFKLEQKTKILYKNNPSISDLQMFNLISLPVERIQQLDY